jgi:sugar/nucleoside kinase (ribokinase family)
VNTLRALTSGFGVHCGVLGAVGGDGLGRVYTASLTGKLDTSRLVTHGELPTARCLVLMDEETGETQLRTCTDGCSCLVPGDVTENALANTSWLYLTGDALHTDGLVPTMLTLAGTQHCQVVFQLGSREVVASYYWQLVGFFRTELIGFVLCNEEEALQWLACEREAQGLAPCELSELLVEDALQALVAATSACCVVTLGHRGCILRSGEYVMRADAVHFRTPDEIVDTCGAGDFFAAGFLSGLINSLSLDDCARFGCLAGAAALRCFGGEASAEVWQWANQQLPAVGLPPVNSGPSSQQDSCPVADYWDSQPGYQATPTPAAADGGYSQPSSQR